MMRLIQILNVSGDTSGINWADPKPNGPVEKVPAHIGGILYDDYI